VATIVYNVNRVHWQDARTVSCKSPIRKFQETTSPFRSALFRTVSLIVDYESSSTRSTLEGRKNKLGYLESFYMRSMLSLQDGPKTFG
jgi:hypothetical protein